MSVSLRGATACGRVPEPALAGFDTRKQMHDALVVQVRRWIDEGVDPTAFGVSARTNKQVKVPLVAIEGAGLTT